MLESDAIDMDKFLGGLRSYCSNLKSRIESRHPRSSHAAIVVEEIDTWDLNLRDYCSNIRREFGYEEIPTPNTYESFTAVESALATLNFDQLTYIKYEQAIVEYLDVLSYFRGLLDTVTP